MQSNQDAPNTYVSSGKDAVDKHKRQRRRAKRTTQSRLRSPTQNLAYVYAGEASLSSTFDIGVLYGLYVGMAESNYKLYILDLRRSRQSAETYDQMFRRLGIMGCLIRTTKNCRVAAEQLADQGVPVVVVGDSPSRPDLPWVASELRQATRVALEYLVSLGHRRIAMHVNVIEDYNYEECHTVYRQVLESQGLPYDEKLIIPTPIGQQGGQQVIRRLMSMPDRPTAVCMTDPMVSIGAMMEARRVGIAVPNELSVLGFDDEQWRFNTLPYMTCICQNAVWLGQEAYRALMDQIEGTTPNIKRPAAWLEVHGSVGPKK